MPFPGLDELQALFQLLPRVERADVETAIQASGKTLSREKMEALRERLDATFRNYFIERLDGLWAAKAPASKTSAQLARIKGTADKLASLLELAPSSGPRQQGRIHELYRLVLIAQANLYAEATGGFPDLPPRMFDAIVSERQRIQRADYRGDEKLGQIIDAIQLLQEILRRAHEYERKKVTPKTERKRREPNKALHILFCSINSDWDDAFEAIPSDGWNAIEGTADGPYFRFLKTLFDSIHARLHQRIRDEYPALAEDLALTPNAIRARFKQTAEAKLPALAKRILAKPAEKK